MGNAAQQENFAVMADFKNFNRDISSKYTISNQLEKDISSKYTIPNLLEKAEIEFCVPK